MCGWASSYASSGPRPNAGRAGRLSQGVRCFSAPDRASLARMDLSRVRHQDLLQTADQAIGEIRDGTSAPGSRSAFPHTRAASVMTLSPLERPRGSLGGRRFLCEPQVHLVPERAGWRRMQGLVPPIKSRTGENASPRPGQTEGGSVRQSRVRSRLGRSPLISAASSLCAPLDTIARGKDGSELFS